MSEVLEIPRHSARRRWVRAGVMVAILPIVVTVSAVSSGAAGVTDQYPYATAPDCSQQFGAGSWCVGGERESARGYGYRTDADWAAWRLVQVGVPAEAVAGLGDGGQWAQKAAASKRTDRRVSTTPSVHSAAVRPVSSADAIGHVAVVEAVNPDGTITVSEFGASAGGTGRTWTGTAAARRFTSFVAFGAAGEGDPGTLAVMPAGTALRAADNGEVYVVAGGAPVYVSSWAAVGGRRAAITVSRDFLEAMPSVPADGTVVSASGRTYVFAGGAPLRVVDTKVLRNPPPVVRVDSAAIEKGGSPGVWAHVRAVPIDGTLVSVKSGFVYVFAGGAPIYVSDWTQIGGVGTTTQIDQTAIDNAGKTGWTSVRAFPLDGAFVTVRAGHVYRFAGGAPVYVSSWAAVGGRRTATLVDQAAIDNAGRAAPWNRVRAYPLNGTFVSVKAGYVYRFAGGAPLHVSSWSSIGGPRRTTLVDEISLDNPGAGPQWARVRMFPVDETVLRAGTAGPYYVVRKGVPHATTTTSAAVVIDPAAIARRGDGGRWDHLRVS